MVPLHITRYFKSFDAAVVVCKKSLLTRRRGQGVKKLRWPREEGRANSKKQHPGVRIDMASVDDGWALGQVRRGAVELFLQGGVSRCVMPTPFRGSTRSRMLQ